LCDTYWLTNDRGNKFVYEVAKIECALELKPNELIKFVQKNSRVFHKEMVCRQCGKPTRYFNSRAEWLGNRSYSKRMAFMSNCAKCQSGIDEKVSLQADLEAEMLSQEKENAMRVAFENGAYKKLNVLQYNFLVALASSKDLTAARKKIGLSERFAMPLVNKLNDLHLINYYVGIDGYSLLAELKSIFQELKFKREVKTIFGSPKALELYGVLKKKHPFVYPEIPICAFVEQSQIKHLIFATKDMGVRDWRMRYFLRARVDFVVCDPEGKPLIAYEYQGSYHRDHDQAEKDAFKRAILNEVGLPLEEITNEDLQDKHP
jgi:Protein of unknown function (DUF2726)